MGSYEALHANFDAEVRALASFVGVEVDDRKLERIREATSFDKARKTGLGTHRRKGAVGDWRGTLSAAVLEDIRQQARPSSWAVSGRLWGPLRWPLVVLGFRTAWSERRAGRH